MDKHAQPSRLRALGRYPVLLAFSLFFVGLFALDLLTPDRAYSELEKSGYIYTVTGRGNFVSSGTALHALHRENILSSLKTAVMKAKSSGITREDVLETVEFIYGGVTYDTNLSRKQML